MSEAQMWEARRDLAALCVVVGASAAIQLLIYDRWIGLLDEGAILQIADQLNRGALLYRDAVHVAWPGVFYLTAGLFRFFGTSILVTRWAMVAAFAILVALVYLLARGVAGRGPALAAGLLAASYRVWVFPHWQMISYASLAVLFLTMSVALVAVDLGRPHRGRILLAGVLAGVAVVFKQDSGGLGFVGLAVFLWCDDRHGRSLRVPGSSSAGRWMGFVAAGLVAPATTALAFGAAGLLGDMLQQTVWAPLVRGRLWALSGYEHHYLSFPPLWPPFSRAHVLRHEGFFNYFPSLLLDVGWEDIYHSVVFQQTVVPEVFVRSFYLLPYATLLALAGNEFWLTAISLRSRPLLRVRRLRLLLFFGGAVLLSFNRPRDWIHLMVLYPPTLVLLAPLIEAVAGDRPGARRRFVLGATTVGLALALAASCALGLAAHAFYDTPLSSPRAGVRVEADTATVLDSLIDSLDVPASPRPPLAALPHHPMLNFLTGRPLATRIMIILPLAKFPDRDERVLADLDRNPETDVVYALQHLTGMPRPQEYAPRFFAGLVERYRLGRVFSSHPVGLILARLEPRPHAAEEEIVYDFAANLDAATVSVIAADGAASLSRDGPAAVSVAAWPFERPVMTVRPAVAPARASLTFELDRLPEVRLRFGVAMNPDEWRHFLPTRLGFTVRINGSAVFDTELDPRRVLDDRRWVWADLPVPGAARHTITFEVSSENAYATELRLAGWARPRLVAAPGD